MIQDRRRIENEAFEGRLLGIVATNALELGVDIGVLDVDGSSLFEIVVAMTRVLARTGMRS